MDKNNFSGKVAGIQWNNALASNLLMLWFVFAIILFSFMLMVPVFAAVAIFSPDELQGLLHDQHTQIRILRNVIKMFVFTGAGILYFLYRDFERAEEMFEAEPLKLAHTDSFYKKLETLCISRGLPMPDLYLFSGSAVNYMITALVLQGPRRKSKVILTEAGLELEAPLQEALAAQIVQRIHSRDALFMTILSFMGFFPHHMRENAIPFIRVILQPFLMITDLIMTPFRNWIIGLRMAKLDVGSLELTKSKGPAHDLLSRLTSLDEVKEYYYEAYLPLFIARSEGPYRLRTLESS